ncbi:MAG: hypothetical protein R3240_14010, partial [Gammaproteobacteria bacterium]|nr:hypothetical protein [Gammaproteobacteria bacterium]
VPDTQPYDDRSNVYTLQELGVTYPRAFQYCDALITKPGYGTVVEVAKLGKPAIFVKRGDWAEEPELVAWWQKHANVREVSRSRFFAGDFVADLQELLESPSKPVEIPDGVPEVIDVINKYL